MNDRDIYFYSDVVDVHRQPLAKYTTAFTGRHLLMTFSQKSGFNTIRTLYEIVVRIIKYLVTSFFVELIGGNMKRNGRPENWRA